MSKEKRRIKKIDRRADRYLKKGADKTSINTMRSKAKMMPGSMIASPGQNRRFVKKQIRKQTSIGDRRPMIPASSVSNISMRAGGSLKPVPSDNKGLSKLPTAVRNKMGFMMKGGSALETGSYKYGGSCGKRMRYNRQRKSF